MTGLTPPLSAEDHVDGPERAELELVMYGDYQCPYTAAAVPVVRGIRDRLAGRLLFAYRHFPLRDIHPDAERAAEAAEAASSQGAFWPMHERLFDSHGVLSEVSLIAQAAELGLDGDSLAAELKSRAYAQRVERDRQSGLASGVTATPAFFVGGRPHAGGHDAGTLAAALEASA